MAETPAAVPAGEWFFEAIFLEHRVYLISRTNWYQTILLTILIL